MVSYCILLVFPVKRFYFSGVYFVLYWSWIDTKYSMSVCGHAVGTVESHYAGEFRFGPLEK